MLKQSEKTKLTQLTLKLTKERSLLKFFDPKIKISDEKRHQKRAVITNFRKISSAYLRLVFSEFQKYLKILI